MHTRPDNYEKWFKTRLEMETKKDRRNYAGETHKRRWQLFELLLKLVGFLLKITGIWFIGSRNARTPELTEKTLYFDNLPPSFDGYKILHLSDFHLNELEKLSEKTIEALEDQTYDLTFMTGDYTTYTSGTFIALDALNTLLEGLKPTEGTIAVLGNHDSANMIAPLEKAGVKVLVNESMELIKGNDKIIITGLDDVHYYFTKDVFTALENSGSGFKILLLHSAALAKEADKNDFSLYLCGHTHGGQICPIKNMPVITHGIPRKQASGLWKWGSTLGYTSRGLGASGLKVRFNCPSEITILTLKKSTRAEILTQY